MSSGSLSQRQIARAKMEAEASLASARSLRDQWVVATCQNPTGLTQKEIDQLSKAFQNRLLTVKWDCEDLEELVSGELNGGGGGSNDKQAINQELSAVTSFIMECRDELIKFTRQLEDYETSRKMYSKHGIAPTSTNHTINNIDNNQNQNNVTSSSTLPNNLVAQTVAVASIIQNPLHNSSHYRRLSNENLATSEAFEEEHFDKRQIEASTTIFNNALYEHFEEEDAITKSINATKVFNNLTRPSAEDICVGTNENEMILEMLETEYYNPPAGLLAKAKYAGPMRNFLDLEWNRFRSTIALLVSFPILLIVFLVI